MGIISKRLADICSPKIETISTDYKGYIDYIDISSIDNENKTIAGFQTLDFKSAPSRARQLLQKGDIIVSTVRPNLNAVAYIEELTENILVASTGYCVLRCKEYDDRRFVFNYCQSPTFIKTLVEQATGASYPAVSGSIIRNCIIPYPYNTERVRIAAVLDKVSDLIALRKQQLAKLDELVKARFVEMFGVFPDNQFGWKTGTIRDVVSDVRYGSSRPAVEGGRYPYLRMNNITYAGELDLTDTKQIDIPDNELDKCTVRRGDVLFNRTNSKELVGKTCVYDRDEPMVLAGFVIRVRLNELMLPEFLSSFLNTDFSKKMLLGMCKTAIGQANINAQEMQSIGIYMPPVALQREFVLFKNQIDKSKSSLRRSLDKLQTLKSALMQEFFG